MLPNSICRQVNRQTKLDRAILIEKIRDRFNSENYKPLSITENTVRIEGVNLRYNFEIFEECEIKIEDVNNQRLINFNFIAIGGVEITFLGMITLIA